MAKRVVIHGLATGYGTLYCKLFRREDHASYADASRDTQRNGTAETVVEETNRAGSYYATSITNGAGGDLTGPHLLQLYTSGTGGNSGWVGDWWVDMTPAGTAAAPIIAASSMADALTIGGNATAAAVEALIHASLENGTAQAGGSSSITLKSTASSVNDRFRNQAVWILSGTGSGQTNFITAYSGTTKVATVQTAWVTQPDNTSVYVVLGRVTS